MVLTRKILPVVIISILILGFILRSHNLTVWPRHGATFDEFAWTWLGINLIKEGVPISWSPHSQYKDRQYLKYQGADFWIVKPYLEHPPLFGLVAGSFALLNDAKDKYDVTLAKIRPLALLLGVFSIFMLFILTRELYGITIAIIASLLYATVPTIVIGSRIVQNENFLIPLWILSLYFISHYLKTKNLLFRNLAILICGLLPLAKLPWIVASVSLSMILAARKKWKDVFLIFIVTLISISIFIVYSIYFDKELFFNLLLFQLARYDLSFVGLHAIFTNPLLVDRYYLDGWIYWGFICLFLLLPNFKKHVFIVFPFLAYLLIFLFAIPNESGHGWYRYPFYPFIIISTALFIKEYFTKNQILAFLFLAFVGFSLLQNSWVVTFGFSYSVLRLVFIGFAFILLSIFFKLKSLDRAVKFASIVWFAILIVLNIWAVTIYNEQ